MKLLSVFYILGVATTTALGAAIREPRVVPAIVNSPPAGTPTPSDPAPVSNSTVFVDDDLTFAGMSAAEIEQHRAKQAQMADAFKPQACPARFIQTVTVPVYFHHVLLYLPQALIPIYKGLVTVDEGKAAVARLNAGFQTGSPRVRFVYQSSNYMTYTTLAGYQNQAIIPDDATQQRDKCSVLARGFRGSSMPASWTRELHIYTTEFVNPNLNGFAWRPASATPFVYDGVWLKASALNVNSPSFLSTTVVHEAGHWLGLLHNFDAPTGVNPCNYVKNTNFAGDFVYDTVKWRDDSNYFTHNCPATGLSWSSAVGACSGLTSTEVQAGISNYMSYSSQRCRTVFTPGQRTKAVYTATAIRGFSSYCAFVL